MNKVKVPFQTPAHRQEGDHSHGSFLITKCLKIAFIEDSLLSSIHDHLTLIYGREPTKIYMYKFIYIYIYIYICLEYISNNHFKSLCGKTKRKEARKRRTFPVTPPAAALINTEKYIFLFPQTLL